MVLEAAVNGQASHLVTLNQCSRLHTSGGQLAHRAHDPSTIFAFFGDSAMSQVALRLPDSLHQYAKQLAAQDDASLNQLILWDSHAVP